MSNFVGLKGEGTKRRVRMFYSGDDVSVLLIKL